MNEIEIQVSIPLPYFAELPYYLWGQTNYDSDGDCKRPTDREWTWLDLENRETGEELSIKGEDDSCRLSSESADACTKAAAFLMQRLLGTSPDELPPNWDRARAMSRTKWLRKSFSGSN